MATLSKVFIVGMILMNIVYPCFSQEKKLSVRDEYLYKIARTDIKSFAQEVSKNTKSDLGRAKSIVRWLTNNFDWKATDYQPRTIQQIIERRGGNCNELALVAIEAMKKLNIKMRRVHEVHIRTESVERGQRAKSLVKERDKGYSVFGRHHNDHIYLEIYDPKARDWFPADPWSGLVGTDEWLKARVGFGPRSGPHPDAPDMIVPIAIFAMDAEGKFTIDRSRHYLVDEFDKLYGGKLHKLSSWKRWKELIDRLNPKVLGAFARSIDLHDSEADIDEFANVYDSLRNSIRKK